MADAEEDEGMSQEQVMSQVSMTGLDGDVTEMPLMASQEEEVEVEPAPMQSQDDKAFQEEPHCQQLDISESSLLSQPAEPQLEDSKLVPGTESSQGSGSETVVKGSPQEPAKVEETEEKVSQTEEKEDSGIASDLLDGIALLRSISRGKANGAKPKTNSKTTKSPNTGLGTSVPPAKNGPANSPGENKEASGDEDSKQAPKQADNVSNKRSRPKTTDEAGKGQKHKPASDHPPANKKAKPDQLNGKTLPAGPRAEPQEAQDESNDEALLLEEKKLQQRYLHIGHDVRFGDLQIQTSNIKVSFTMDKEMGIAELCSHLERAALLTTDHYFIRIKEKSTANDGEGRTYFGGVQTVTMDVWPSHKPDMRAVDALNTSIRLFGCKDQDSEKRHKAQFNGNSCSHDETKRFFREVFSTPKHAIKTIRVEPNSVFSATDNAVMDPKYGLNIETLVKCLGKRDCVTDVKHQVTGGVNFTFTCWKTQRICKPTIQKSGSIQLMLVDAPRRIRLETMKFLLDFCQDAFRPLSELNLTKRTLDKRLKARPLAEERERELAQLAARKDQAS